VRGFLFRLETADGSPAEPPKLESAVANWGAGDVIPLGTARSLVVLAVRANESDQEMPVLVVEDVAG
jgi:hypothetical protein